MQNLNYQEMTMKKTLIHSYIKVKNMKNNELQIIKTDIVPETYKSVLVFIKEDKK